MEVRDRYGWDLDPADSKGVVRGRTKLGQLTLWLIPAEPLRAVVDEELGKGLSHPGLYVLLDEESERAYVGESSNLKARLGQHLDHPPKELGRFDRALILNDGRAAVHSRFNDSTLREALEQATIKFLLEGGSHSLVNQQKRMPELSVTQQTLFESLRAELGHVLYELELITSRPRATVDSAILRPQDAATRFPSVGIVDIKGYEGKLKGEPVYFRKGSEKPQGLQVTIRVGEPFGKSVVQGRGFLCYNRGRCYLIPNSEVRSWLGVKLEQQTVDIFLDIEGETLRTAGLPPLSVAQFAGPKSSSA
jgi:GIY-YIG catalytic domain-containing protein